MVRPEWTSVRKDFWLPSLNQVSGCTGIGESGPIFPQATVSFFVRKRKQDGFEVSLSGMSSCRRFQRLS